MEQYQLQIRRETTDGWRLLEHPYDYFGAGSQSVEFRVVELEHLDEILEAESTDPDGLSEELKEFVTEWEEYTFTIENQAPQKPTVSVSVDYADYQNGFTKQAKVKAKISVTPGSDPDASDSVELNFGEGSPTEDGYFGLGDYTVKVRSVDEFGQTSDWTESSFSITTQKADMKFTSTMLGDASSISGSSAAVSMTVNVVSQRPVRIEVADMYGDGTILHNASLSGSGTTTFDKTYVGGRHLLAAKGTGLFGDTGFASKLFVVGSATHQGGGKMTDTGCVLTDTGMYQNGKPVAYINGFSVKNPAISGHSSANDTWTVEGLVLNGGWEQIATGTAAYPGNFDGSSAQGFIQGGSDNTRVCFAYKQNRYVQLRFTYYSDHVRCMRGAGTTMSYSVEYAFMNDQMSESMWDSIVASRKYDVITSLEGPGYIDPSILRVPEGGDVDVAFGPYVGCYLKQLLVDGKEVSTSTLLSARSHTFSNIRTNHTIKAVFAEIPVLAVKDSISMSTLVRPKGDVSNAFKVSGTDIYGRNQVYYFGGAYNEAGLFSQSQYVWPGTYTVEPLDRQWLFAAGGNVSVDLRGTSAGEAVFSSSVSSYGRYTDAKWKSNLVWEHTKLSDE